jgi:hypothetical protein
MAQIIRKAAVVCGLAGVLAVAAAVPSLAQVVVVEPYYGGPYGNSYYAGPYGGYAYAPGYRSYRYRYWQAPVEYDTSGMAYSTHDLGWQWGPPTGAPNNPCWSGQRAMNRC